MPERNPTPVHADVRYEKTDAQGGAIIALAALLVVTGLIVQLSAGWLFDYLKESEQRKYPPLPALAARERARLPHDLHKIPPPRLQEFEPLDLAKLRQIEDSLLNNYGWVERDKGVVRIPIEEAMRLFVETKKPGVKEGGK